jgi:hypothetical protein
MDTASFEPCLPPWSSVLESFVASMVGTASAGARRDEAVAAAPAAFSGIAPEHWSLLFGAVLERLARDTEPVAPEIRRSVMECVAALEQLGRMPAAPNRP